MRWRKWAKVTAIQLLAISSSASAAPLVGEELETFASVCEEAPMPPEWDGDAIVVDLDDLRHDGELIEFDDGTAIRMNRAADGAITVTLLGKEDCLDACPACELKPIPMPEVERVDRTVADFQVRYASLLAAGKSQEAEALATEFLAGDETSAIPADPRKLSPTFARSPQPILQHRVGYNPRNESPPASPTTARWDEISRRTITLRFHGATLRDVASFFQLATGLNVALVDVPDLSRAIHLECNDQPIAEALAALARVADLAVIPNGDEIIIKPAR